MKTWEEAKVMELSISATATEEAETYSCKPDNNNKPAQQPPVPDFSFGGNDSDGDNYLIDTLS